MWHDAGISSFHCPTKIIFGVGAHERLAEVLRERAVHRLLVLTDAELANSGIHQKVMAVLSRAEVATTVFSDIGADPGDSTLHAAFEVGRAHRAETLLAVGSDAAIKVAKALGTLIAVPPALIAIPTTAGAGAAVSHACEIAILDPLTVGSLSASVAAQAGVDSFSHAFESYLSKRATVFSDAVNLHAMTLIASSIRAFVADRNNQSAALDMLCGSALAEMSFGVTGLGNVNCMAKSVAALFPVSRRLATAVCLPHAAAFNAPVHPERYARIAEILGVDGSGRSEVQRGTLAIRGLRALCSDLGIPLRLRDIGVTEDRLDELARLCSADDGNSCNPRPTSEQDFQALFGAAY